MNRQPIESMSLQQIAELLEQDGYDELLGREADIRQAAAQSSLLWTHERLVVSMPSRGIEIDARPEH